MTEQFTDNTPLTVNESGIIEPIAIKITILADLYPSAVEKYSQDGGIEALEKFFNEVSPIKSVNPDWVKQRAISVEAI